MRNTTMRDKLSGLLDPESTRSAASSKVGSGARSTRRAVANGKPSIAEIGNRRPPNDATTYSSPRYIDPRRQKNPFSVHAYPLISVPDPEEVVPAVADPALAEPEFAEMATVDAPLAEAEQTFPELNVQAATKEPEVEDAPPSVSVSPALETGPVLVTVPAATLEIPSIAVPPPEPVSLLQPVTAAIEETQQIMLPPNLTWLEKPTPFGADLRSIVDKSRDAKASVVFTLQQSTMRQTELRGQITELQRKLDQEEFLGEQQREYLRQLDEVIAACALVAEQSAGIEEILRPTPAAAKKHTNGNGLPRKINGGRWASDKSAMCTREEIIRFFAQNPNTNWDVDEIVKTLPAKKKDHAKAYLPSLLSNLHHDQLVQRIGRGFYRSLDGGTAQA